MSDIHFEQHQIIGQGHFATLGLNRPQKRNALSGEMLSEITQSVVSLARDTECRGLFIYGRGKHFCAGADLEWMRSSQSLDKSENTV